MTSSRGLTILLDALATVLFAAPAAEILEALRETGRARAAGIGEMRSLPRDADGGMGITDPWPKG